MFFALFLRMWLPFHDYQYISIAEENRPKNKVKGWFPLKKTFLRTGTDRKVSFVLEPLVPTESSQLDKGNVPVRSRPEENYPEWKPAFTGIILK